MNQALSEHCIEHNHSRSSLVLEMLDHRHAVALELLSWDYQAYRGLGL